MSRCPPKILKRLSAFPQKALTFLGFSCTTSGGTVQNAGQHLGQWDRQGNSGCDQKSQPSSCCFPGQQLALASTPPAPSAPHHSPLSLTSSPARMACVSTHLFPWFPHLVHLLASFPQEASLSCPRACTVLSLLVVLNPGP